MSRRITVCFITILLVIGSTPGLAALTVPGEGGATHAPQTTLSEPLPACATTQNQTLSVSAGPDFQASKDERVRFVADLDPDDAEARVASYEWRDQSGNRNAGKGKGKNGGGSSQLLSTQQSFETQLKAGEHTITLTVETTDGRTLTDTVNVTVRGKGSGAERDSPPEADAGDCRMVIAGEDTELDGTESYDRDGTIESYDWDTDGDSETDTTGPTPTVQFHDLGNRTVELTVTDDGGNTDTDAVNLFVNDRPRAAFDYAPTRPNPDEEATFDASAASDDLGGIDAYRWDFDGDGTTDATGANVSHAFETPGNHTVALTVVDAYGVSNTTTRTIHVNYPPTANASESERRASVGEPLTLNGTESSDPEDDIARYDWDVDGDGEFERSGATVPHIYNTSGTRNVTLRVTDAGGLTDTDTIRVQVNTPPTARINASNTTIRVGESVAFDATASSDPDGEVVRYEWDFDGDGTTDATGANATHTYDADGAYTVRLTVTDDDGATDTATRIITTLPEEIEKDPSGLPDPPDEPNGGSGTGDPHYTTFDGRNYDFQGVGEFVLAREPNGSLSVQGRLEPYNNGPVSVTEAAATSLDGHNVTIDTADATPLVVDGERHSLEPTDRLAVGNGTVFRRGSNYIIVYPGEDNEVDDGDERLTIEHRGRFLDIALTLRDDRKRAVEGILGTPAEDAPDIALANGTAISPSDYDALYGAFRDDWRVTNRSESHFHYESGESPDGFYDPEYPSQLLSVEDLPDDERSAAEQAAIEAGLEPGTPAFENAVLDYALTGDEAYLESAATSQPVNASFSVEAGSSFDASVGSPVTFAATVSNESAENVSVEWRFGDGATATGTETTHTFAETGTYTVTVTATGPNDGIARDTLAVTVAENATTDQPPIPVVEQTRVNASHTRLDASESIDPDGNVSGYAWDTDGDGAVDADGSTVTVSLSATPTDVSLVVLDDDGNQVSETVVVPGLGNVSIGATISANRTMVQPGGVIAFDASDSQGVGLTYTWTFGNGATATGPTATQAFDAPGTYAVEVTVTDADGETTTETKNVVVLADARFQSFEGGRGDWSFYDSFQQRGGAVDGSYSAGSRDGYAERVQARWKAYDGGEKPRKFSFYYREESYNDGGGIRLRNSDGNVEVGFATEDAAWKLHDADGVTHLYDGEGYDRWVYVEFTFDWANDEYVVYVEDQASGTSRTYTGELRHGANIETAEIANWNDGWDWGSDFYMRFDSIAFENVDADDPRPKPQATATRQQGDNYLLSDADDTDGGQSYVWEFGDRLLQNGDPSPVHRYERPGTYTAKVSTRNEHGRVARDTVTLRVNRTDDYRESFEHGLRTWSTYDSFQQRGGAVDGRYSAGSRDGYAERVQARDTVYPGGHKPRKFSFYYREESYNDGGGIRLRNTDGNVEVGFAAEDTAWKLHDADGVTHLYDGDGYNRWVYVEFTFDWANDEYVVYVEDQHTGTSRMYTGELRHGANIETAEIANWNDGWDWGSDFYMRFDNVEFESTAPNESWPEVDATATHKYGDIVEVANATDANRDQRSYFWEFGDGLKQQAATPDHKYERPGTYTAKVSTRDENGRVSRDTVTFHVNRTDDYRESFEHGLRTWSTYDSFQQRGGAVHGRYSAGSRDGYAERVQARDTVYPGGHKPRKFSFYYREESYNDGGGIRLRNSDGNVEIGFATEDAAWKLHDADGVTHLYDGEGYDRWVYVEFTFDWENDEYVVYAEDQASGTSRMYTGDLRHGANIETAEIANWNDGWDWGSDFYMRFDEIRFESVTPNQSWPEVNATATHKYGDIVEVANATDTNRDQRSYFWEFGDGLKQQAATPDHKYERPGTYTAKVSTRNDDGQVSRDTVTFHVNRTDDYRESFEHGLRTWSTYDSFQQRGGAVHGSYSVGSRDGYAERVQARDTVYPDGHKPQKFSFYYREESYNDGGGIRLRNTDGNVEIGFATEDAAWKLHDADGVTQLYGGEGYDRWVYVEFTFDWANGTYTVYVEDQASGTSRTHTGELRHGANIETAEIANWNDGWDWGSDFYMRFDDIRFTDEDEG